MILPQKTQVLTEEKKVAIATKAQEGTFVASGGVNDLTCLVEDSNGNKHLAVKVVNVEGEVSAESTTSAEVLTDNNDLALATLEQDGNVLSADSATNLTCLVETETGKQTALKVFALDGTLLASDGSSNTTCLVQDGDGNKQLALKVFNLGGSSSDWQDKPADWSDIRLDCPKNSIALYAGVKSDYSQYDNLGFTATCVGGYKVYIDGVQYGSTYASGSQCSITWSTSGITTGDDITTPSALKAHKIWIEPAISGNNITAFSAAKVVASGGEQQGRLWVHFNLSNFISIENLLVRNGSDNTQCKAITAKNNNINVSKILNCARYGENLEYIAQLTGDGTSQYSIAGTFYQCYKIKQISLKNMLITQASSAFFKCYELEEITTSNVLLQPTDNSLANTYSNCYKLKQILPTTYTTALTAMNSYIVYDTGLEDMVLDVSSATNLTILGCLGSASRFMSGFKGLRVSSSAPFDYGITNPNPPAQINVSYTGMDRTALVQLFNDLPTVSGGQVVNVTGTTGSEDLTADDVLIATNKGWTVTGGPQPIPDWQLGDRLDGKATFVGYFDSVNPDDSTTQRYAFFALDGNYRHGKLKFSTTSIDFLPTHNYTYNSLPSHLNEITESATWTMAKVIAAGISDFPIFDKANSVSVSFNGTTYYGKVPNAVELKAIADNKTVIDNADTSGERTLATWGQWDGSTKDRVWTCTNRDNTYAFQVITDTNFRNNYPNTEYGIIPIIEIPVPAGHGA